MTQTGDAVARTAQALLGTRFRPQGRDPAFGLDCVGLAAAALAGAGIVVDVRGDHPQRGGDPGRIAAMIDAVGIVRIDPIAAGTGDLLLLEAGPAQFHMAIVTANGFVHADAGLRRVVETPGAPSWPVIGAWRVREQQG